MGQVGWLRAHSFGNLGEIGPEVWTEIARQFLQGPAAAQAQRNFRRDEFATSTGHLESGTWVLSSSDGDADGGEL